MTLAGRDNKENVVASCCEVDPAAPCEPLPQSEHKASWEGPTFSKANTQVSGAHLYAFVWCRVGVDALKSKSGEKNI